MFGKKKDEEKVLIPCYAMAVQNSGKKIIMLYLQEEE